jgi:short-subunit dehydrogenase
MNIVVTKVTDSNPSALITGASAGIGAEFASQLAARGCDLILVARRGERLTSLADGLSTKFGVDTQIIPVDLAQEDSLAHVVRVIQEQDNIKYLINNAGYGVSGKFVEVELQKHIDMMHVHDLASLSLTWAALPGMRERKIGFVINVSSMAAFLPTRSVTYASTKAFLVTFSEALQNDIKDTGVRVQVLCPGFTITEFHDTPEYENFRRSRIPRFLWLPVEQVVAESLSALGKKRVICVPSLQYRIIAGFSRNSLTSWLVRAIAKKFFNK